MARTVPGSGAVIEPIFDEIFGVRAVKVVNGGSLYTSDDPPRLTIQGCGTPDAEALLYPIIDDDSGQIIHVRVLNRGRGYDPLRLQIVPQDETPNVVTSFDVNRIWQTHPNSPTAGVFTLNSDNKKTDRLTITSDNHPRPTPIAAERVPGGGPLVDRNFNQTFIYRGGKDVPNPAAREEQTNKVTGVLANGGLLHTPEWGSISNAPVGFSIDTVKYDYIKNTDTYDTITDSNIQYYQSSKTIDQFALTNGVFGWGDIQQFVWKIKVEFDNIMLTVNQVDETLGNVEVGRVVDEIGGNAQGTIAKVVRDNTNQVTRIYLRETSGDFAENDKFLGSTGFSFTVNAVPYNFVNGIFYIDFGADAAEFGAFVPGQYYFAPENIKVQRNYLIIWDQSDATNSPGSHHTDGHPMQFSTTRDGLLNGGALYYNSTGSSAAPAVDYETELQPIFLMNADETNKIYYYCKNHRYMSGHEGDEGYMILDPTVEAHTPANDYYVRNFFATGPDYGRHVDGHSKILGMSYDGYPIYGPWGYNSSGTVAREVSGYRLRTTAELPGARPEVTTATTVTYAVTVSGGQFLFDGARPNFLDFKRGKTYVFQQNDSSNDDQPSVNHLLLSTVENGWHSTGNPSDLGDTSYLYTGQGIKYYINGSEVTYTNYISGFQLATTREMRWTVPVDAPPALYVFGYSTSNLGLRTVQGGYILGDLTQDYIWASGVGTLDEYNGKFAVTPEYPNGTYAYFMTEDG